MAVANGVRASEIPGAVWVKAQASVGAGECVEVAGLPEGEVAIRNSRHPEGPALIFTKAEMRAFLEGAKGYEFDRFADLA
ncbi:DUF397 domain-containing protein [Streptomyces antimicrobicus]|uniref:DUF397 domain-containing protein n=1 Tax=Streptomyces antimicrobicus TaxID=2883108 RepID=A0ABS8BEH7_9ACTN|nr:DUF397 domain-containing protein [Streptomyces antimicrobicus]MCB5183044.1 DUF397 domain-containing protein [Streptomyces antimicrobicus]